jgi:DNA-binding NarL/FixJ family response regulator
VESLLQHKPFLTERASEIVLDGFRRGLAPQPSSESGRLTPREREVLQLLAEGCSNKEVAARLGISGKTAEAHRANIMRKLGAHSVGELVRYAIRNNIVQA